MASVKSYQEEKQSELDPCNKVIKALDETNQPEGVLECVLEACDSSHSWAQANYEADQSHFSTPKGNQIIAQNMYLCDTS